MNPPIANAFGRWWLGGAKYQASAFLAGASWRVGIVEALRPSGRTLAGCRGLEDIVDVFRGRWHWLPDPLWQAWDQVFPPVMLLARGGDDCDGWAMTHAQAVEAVLEAYGWHSWIVSYLADPWQESHHFAAAVDPRGRVWAIQPQPSILQRSDLQIVYGPYPSVGEAVRAIAAGYGAEVVWYDVRYPDWRPYIPNITPGSPASAGGFS